MIKYIKRVISVALAISMLSSLSIAFAADKKGDMNSDGQITLSDVRAIMNIASSVNVVDEATFSNADMNSDGVVDLEDVKSALKKAVDVDPSWRLGKITQLSPKKKHESSQKVTYCQIKEYCGETLAASPINDRSNPLFSPLLKGTYDYVASGPVTSAQSGDAYYVLKSGRRVYADDVKVFEGYKLPDNTALLKDVVIYEDNSTKMYVALDWRVPFNVSIKPQQYQTGYDNREHNVKDGKFTGEYMDVTFFYTPETQGKLSFPESDTIKSCKWIVNKESKTATLRIYFREAGEFYGYNVTYDENNLLVISVKEPVKSLKGRVIELDPGHGGNDPGAGSGTGVYEDDLAYAIALKLKTYLEKEGATVVLSRDNSASVPDIAERRISFIKNNPDMMVAIHLDASSSKSVNGSSVYYYKNYSAPLAVAISKNLPKTLNNGGYNLTNRGYHYYPFKVTRIENCPSVLVECGFISNTTPVKTPAKGGEIQANCDFSVLNSATGQAYVAKGIYNGIMEYFGK